MVETNNELNRWQQYYVDTLYGGKKPRGNVSKQELEFLGKVKSTVRVYFPEAADAPAHFEDYVVTLDDCNIPEGKISVLVLASNFTLWRSRNYTIQTF